MSGLVLSRVDTAISTRRLPNYLLALYLRTLCVWHIIIMKPKSLQPVSSCLITESFKCHLLLNAEEYKQASKTRYGCPLMVLLGKFHSRHFFTSSVNRQTSSYLEPHHVPQGSVTGNTLFARTPGIYENMFQWIIITEWCMCDNGLWTRRKCCGVQR